MSPEPSPHEILGLSPGANRSAIEAAYRRLMKQHHPDVPGGDVESAKTIIHAYRSLSRAERRLPVVVEAPAVAAGAKRRWSVGMGALLAAVIFWWAPWPLPSLDRDGGEVPLSAVPAAAPERPVAPLLQARVAPDAAAVEAGVDEARQLSRQTPALALAYSRSCAADLSRLPGEALLDHCLGFDMAAAKRPSPSLWWSMQEMRARHSRAAARVLEDQVLAEARVREIRRQVERRLAGP